MSVKRSVAWMGLAQALSFIVQFGSSVIVARYLTPHELGVFAVGLSVVAILSVLQSFGFQPLLVRESVLTTSLEDTAATGNAAVSILFAIAIWVSSIFAAGIFDEPQLRSVLEILSVTPLIGIPSFLIGALMERQARFKALAIITMLSGIVNALTMTLLVAFNFGVVSLAYASVASTVTMAALVVACSRKELRFRVRVVEWRRVLGFGSQVFAASSLIILSPRIGEVLLGRLLGLSSLGLYNRANGLCNILWGGIHPIIGRVVLVDFAQTFRKTGTLRERYIRTVTMVTGVLWPAFIGLAVVAHPFIIVVYGRQWIGAAAILVYLSISSAILVMSTVAWEVCTVTGNLGIQVRLESTRVLVSLGLLVATSLFSLEAVAMSRIVEAMVTFVLYRPHLNRMTNTRLHDFTISYAKGVLLSVGTATPAFLITRLPESVGSPELLLSVGILAGVSAWGMLLFVLRHPLADEIVATANARFPARL